MPFIFGAHFLIALACAVHVIRTRQEMYWLFLLFMFPMLGSAVYLLAVILPGFSNSSHVRSAQAALDPGRELRAANKELVVRRTPAVLKRAGDAHMELGHFEDALALYQEASRSAFADDPAVLQGLSRAQFECGRFDEALKTLETLQHSNPSARMPNAHLVFARTLVELGRTDEAFREFEAVSGYFPGAEAKARWAEALERHGRKDEAQLIWREIVETARIIPAHSRKLQSKWINLARSRV